MILRARTLFLAWLAYGALQLTLLGLPGATAQPGIASRAAHAQTESQSVSVGKRVLAPDPVDRRAPTTPFAPSVHVRLDLPEQIAREALVAFVRPLAGRDPVALPPARAPPALS
jgi:hypothetical protein